MGNLCPDLIGNALADFTEPTVYVGFSGGIDSTVLLHLCARWRDNGGNKAIKAIHVHHGLSPNADSWTLHCERLCQQLGIPLTVEKVILNRSEASLEQVARDARYEVFSRYLQQPAILLQAHHSRDQAETLLFRLLRGAGVRGLGGIPRQRALAAGTLLRPLLECGRDEIERYARQQQLEWIEDESNQSIDYDRNYLRLEVLPLLKQRWPALETRFAAAARQCQEADVLLTELGQELLHEAKIFGEGMLSGLVGVRINFLSQLTPSRQHLLLRSWLEYLQLPLPERSQLEQIINDMLSQRADAQPCFCWGGGTVLYRWQGALFGLEARHHETEPQPVEVALEQQQLELPCNGALQIRVEAHKLALNISASRLSVRYRHELDEPGKIKVAGRLGSKTLKRWLQEYQVPAWLRSRVPLLYCDSQLVAVPGLWVCDGWQAAKGEPGSVIEWYPPWHRGNSH